MNTPIQPPSTPPPNSPGSPDPTRRGSPSERANPTRERASSSQLQLRQQVLDLFNLPSTDFQETSDRIWRAISELNPEFEAQTATFITSHWDKFSQVRTGATWSSLKETLQEQMGQEQIVAGKKNISWDKFRFQFIDLVQTLSNQALLQMGAPPVKGHALGTTGWRSDVDWEICPTTPNMSETDLMMAKLIFDSVTAHMLGREVEGTLGREPGSALDIEFYTEHYAKQHDTFALLSLPNTRSEFYVQELTMSALQQIRAYSNDVSQWETWKAATLGRLEEGSNLRTIMTQVFDNVEKFEILLERETLRQMDFEARVLEKGEGADLNTLRQEIQSMPLEELQAATARLGGKESERYKLAQCTLKAGRLLHLSQMIDEDTQQATDLLQQIERLSASQEAQSPAGHAKLQKKQAEYELKCLDASIKLALRTSFFEGAIYTQSEYNRTVLGPEGQAAQRAEEHALQRRSSDTDQSHVVFHNPVSSRPRSSSFSSPPLAAIAALETGAQLEHSVGSLLRQSKRPPSPERDTALLKAAIAGAKYARRSVGALSDSVELSQGHTAGVTSLSHKTRELETCQRRKILNQTSFGMLLHEALTRLKLERVDEIVQKVKQFFEPGGVLYDEKAATKLSTREKYAPLIAFLAGRGLKTVLSETGDLSAADAEVELILQSKIGSAQHTKPEVKTLFDRAEEITLEKLNLNTPEKAMRYYLSLDRTSAFVLQQAFKDVDFAQAREPNLTELWNRTALAE